MTLALVSACVTILVGFAWIELVRVFLDREA